jgi:enoyl-CoA hydratase/carnithine racemase
MIAPRAFRFEAGDDGVATLTLDRPARLNALTFEAYRELGEVFRALAGEAGVRAVVLTGAGGAFSSGGDVHEIIGKLVTAGEDRVRAFCRLVGESVRAMRALEKPIVAAVSGVAAGGGAALAIAADVRVAAADARIGFVFPRVGLSAADMGVTWLLPRLVGLGRASALLLTGDLVDAAAAERCGLVDRVVPPADLAREARALAARVAGGPALAHAATKRMLEASASLGLEDALAAEVEAQVPCMLSEDFREGHRAFVERRAALFRGR